MNDVFGAKSQVFGGAFSADESEIQFGLSNGNQDSDELGLAIEQAQFQYMQRIGKAFDITRNAVYVIRGRSEGNGTFNQIAGVRAITEEFLRTYADVCSMDKNILNFETSSGCGTTREVREAFRLQSLLLIGISQQVSGEDMMIRRGLPFTFLSLEHQTAQARRASV